MARISELTKQIKAHRSGAESAYEERRRLILEAAANGYSDSQIADAAGISRQLVERIRSGRPRRS